MYTNRERKIVRSYGKWLSNMDWDIFSAFTYRFNKREKQNFNIYDNSTVEIKLFKIKFHLK